MLSFQEILKIFIFIDNGVSEIIIFFKINPIIFGHILYHMLSDEQIQTSAKKILNVEEPLQIILFGSYARGEATEESDLDLLVIVKDIQKRGRKMVTYRNAIGRVAPGVGVDILVYSEDEALKPVPGTVLYWALSEGKILYESAARK